MESTKPLYTLLVTPTKKRYPAHPPQIMETDIDIATLQNMRGLKRRMESNGEYVAKIARVTAGDLDNVEPIRASAALLLPDDKRVDDLIGFLHEVAHEHGHSLPIESDPHVAQMRLTILQWVRTL